MTKQSTIKVLLIDDRHEDARILSNTLAQSTRWQFDVVHAAPFPPGISGSAPERYDVILLAYSALAEQPLEAFRRQQAPAPLILIADQEREIGTGQSLDGGTEDCLLREHFRSPLAARLIAHVVERDRLKAELARKAQALHASEARFRTVVSNAPLIMATVNRDGIITFAQGKRLESLGVTQKELIGQSVLDHPLSTPELQGYLHRVLAGETFSATVALPPLGLLFETQFSPLRDSRGEVAGGVAVALDVTERHRAETAERKQRALAEALRDTVAVLTGTLDPHEVMNRILDNVGRVVPHDSATITLIEGDEVYVAYTRGRLEPLIGTVLKTLRFPVAKSSHQQMIRTRQPCLIADVRDCPDWVYVPGIAWIRSYVGIPLLSRGEVIGFLNLDSARPNFFTPEHAERLKAFADQTAVAIENAQLYEQALQHTDDLEQRVQERTAALEHERMRLNAILDAMGEGVVYGEISQRSEIFYANPAFCKMTGYTPEELAKGVSFPQHFVATEVDFEAAIERVIDAIRHTGSWRAEVCLRRKDKSTFDAHLTVSLVDERPTGELVGVALIRDISKEKQLQEQKDRFIANASHELRTPLTNLKMRLYLLRKQPHLLNDHLQVLNQVTSRMQELVEDLLDVSRFERGIMQLSQRVVVLQELLLDAIAVQRPHAEHKSIHISHRLPTDPLLTYVDASRMMQVITNLIVNAINYTGENGQISVELETRQTGGAPNAVIRVRDTGVGIAPHLLPQIFDPFFRANVGNVRGTGLGLTIAREIVRLHGGTISVESQVEVGTTFTVTLPISAPEAERAGKA